MIAETAEPLPEFDDPAFGALFDRWADRRVVLLGEASHGTSEFYRSRAVAPLSPKHRGEGVPETYPFGV